MLAVVDRTPWTTLSVLIGRDVDVITKLHGDVHMNAPLWARTYVPGQCSYSGRIVMVSLSKCTALYYAKNTQYMYFRALKVQFVRI